MINSSKKPEILAPCGSYDIMIAAIKAGADACYFGGNKFGARAYATNFDKESTIKAIQYAHIHGTRLYLTVNTLFKDNEIKELYDYILPYYEAGLDAVIVQDLGVFKFIKDMFPDLPIHCSTQMNITSVHGASMMKELGASRIVTAREMSLCEIIGIKEKVDIEIESFVHGAMCYSYSGGCLMSSLAGGRSGNRGRCAQPCRKAYDGEYILSMKDMCTLANIPDIIEAGIDSLKIEGRMKNEYYVASAVNAYRELVDDYMAGDFSERKAYNLQFKLANVFNRGGFCKGYYNMHNGPEMISKLRPNNQGVVVGKITQAAKGEVGLKLYEDLYKQDVLELKLKDGSILEITSGIDGNKGKTVYLKAPKTKLVCLGKEVLRTRCNKILDDINNDIINKNSRLKLNGRLVAKVGYPLELTLSREINGEIYEATVVADIVQLSQKKTEDMALIKEKICQLGQTKYYMDELLMEVDEDAFVQVGSLKAIRRATLEKLEDVIANAFSRNSEVVKRNIYNTDDCDATLPVSGCQYTNGEPSVEDLEINVGVLNISQLKNVINMDISGIYMKSSLYKSAQKNGYIDSLSDKNIKMYIELPEVIRNDFDLSKYLPNNDINGIYINNIDGYAAVKAFIENNAEDEFVKRVKSGNIKLICGIYGYNCLSRKFIMDGLPGITYEIPKELNKDELENLLYGEKHNNELVVYEHQRVMLSAQCVVKNTLGCSKKNENKKICDDKGNAFYCKAFCDECINVIYNGKPLNIKKYVDDDLVKKLKLKSIRYNFTIEDDTVIDEISYTTGHFKRGVE